MRVIWEEEKFVFFLTHSRSLTELDGGRRLSLLPSDDRWVAMIELEWYLDTEVMEMDYNDDYITIWHFLIVSCLLS